MSVKRKTPWIAIVALHQPDAIRPFVILNEDMDGPQQFGSVEEIERLMGRHILGEGVWTAFNFHTGEQRVLA
jgi:hypothetical protein